MDTIFTYSVLDYILYIKVHYPPVVLEQAPY